MKESVEDFINDNRDAFDSYEPGNKVWTAIEKELPVHKKKQANILQMIWMRRSLIAAAVILMVTSVYYLSPLSNQHQSAAIAVAYNSELPVEYAEEVYHFTRLIELKHEQLKKVEKEQPELYRQFAGDISKLDSNYQALRNELPGHPNQEVLIQTMISNLKWQIDLLNQQLTIIQKIKHSKKTTNEKISKSA